MIQKSTMKLMLMSGMLIISTTPLSYAQDKGPLFDVKVPRLEATPVALQDITTTSPPRPDKTISEKLWYWQLLKGVVIEAAKYNRDKQSDGRPYQQGNVR